MPHWYLVWWFCGIVSISDHRFRLTLDRDNDGMHMWSPYLLCVEFMLRSLFWLLESPSHTSWQSIIELVVRYSEEESERENCALVCFYLRPIPLHYHFGFLTYVARLYSSGVWIALCLCLMISLTICFV